MVCFGLEDYQPYQSEHPRYHKPLTGFDMPIHRATTRDNFLENAKERRSTHKYQLETGTNQIESQESRVTLQWHLAEKDHVVKTDLGL
jgi:hypothetical protein